MNLSDQYKKNIEVIEEQMKTFSQEVTLIAVSKYVGELEIKAAYQIGQRDFGENRPDELLKKSQILQNSCPDIRWHFIGNIQSNKIKTILETPNLFAVHSIDKKDHLKKILSLLKTKVRLFFQVNTSDENQKGGVVHQENLFELVEMIKDHPYGIYEGLMTMGKLQMNDFEEVTRQCFKKLVRFGDSIFDQYEMKSKYSMGMSGDYTIALEEGANYIRVGSSIFS